MNSNIFLRGFNYCAKKGLLNWLNDRTYLDLMFRYRLGSRINWNNPKTFNEKLQWLKLYDRNPNYQYMVDKFKVKEYVGSLIGEQYIIPTLGIWNSVDEIDFDALPNSFVLKCTHDSGSVVLCPDKSNFDKELTIHKLQKSLNKDMYYWGREWPYKGLERRIIAEEYLRNESGSDLKDYKVLCFDGEPKLIELHQNRFTDKQSQDYYDTDWKLAGITQNGTGLYGESNALVDKPASLDLMLSLSSILSKGIPHIRVDWYYVNGKLYFGELTLYDGSGFEPYDSIEDDLLIGSWINLPVSGK